MRLFNRHESCATEDNFYTLSSPPTGIPTFTTGTGTSISVPITVNAQSTFGAGASAEDMQFLCLKIQQHLRILYKWISTFSRSKHYLFATTEGSPTPGTSITVTGLSPSNTYNF